MSWNDMQSPPKKQYSQRTVAIVGVGFIALIIIATALVGNYTGHKKPSNAAASGDTTTSSTEIPTTSTTMAPTTTTLAGPGADGKNAIETRAPDGQHTNSSTPSGDAKDTNVPIGTPAQLAKSYPRSSSNLSDDQFNHATEVAATFATADATGVGADKFSYYYNKDTGPENLPWIKDMQIKWVYATEKTVGTVQATVWYQGTVKSSGKFATLVTQDIFLDKDSMNVIEPRLLKSRGMTPPTPCCVTVVTQ